MHKYDDYYRILQVHYLAEPEVIESAYKRLAKKYHPDVSKNENSAEMMQKLNQAYEVLGNPDKKRLYDLEWKDKYGKPCGNDCDQKNAYKKDERSFSTAKSILEEYFRNIMNSSFDYCYELISSTDKKNITKDDFVSWQSAVSKVYHLKEFSCMICGVYRNKLLNGQLLGDVVEFIVNTEEYNAVMDIMEKDAVTKLMILEDGKWRVVIGYERLKPLIGKFKALNGLIAAKSVINELVEGHSKVDSLTGLLNQRGIVEKVEDEIYRFDRYGSIFSLIICDIDIAGINSGDEEQELKDCAVKLVGEILQNSLRRLDAAGRWGEKSFLILLPETGRNSAIKTAHKIRRILKSKKLIYKDKAFNLCVKLGTVEYESSMEESMDKIYSHIVI